MSTLNTIIPARAAPFEVVTKRVRLLSAAVSAVMMIGASVDVLDPPTAKVSNSVLLVATSLAGSVDSGPGPEIMTAPAGPPVLSGFSLGLPMNTSLDLSAGMKRSIRIDVRPQRVDVERNSPCRCSAIGCRINLGPSAKSAEDN